MSTVPISTFGRIEQFDPELESFATYEERIRLFFEANDIAEEKKVPIFLSIIGTRSYSLLRDLLLPDKPRDKDLKTLMEVLKAHYEPTPSVIVERFNFYRRDQKIGESVEEFKAELKKLSTHCSFGTHLDDALRDRFVCGLRSTIVQKKLLAEKNLTFAGAVEIASNMQRVESQARTMNNSGDSCTTPSIQKVTPHHGQQSCIHCGKSNHTSGQCRYKDTLCFNCGKRGHIKAVCRFRRSTPFSGQSLYSKPLRGRAEKTSPQGRQRQERTKWIEEVEEDTAVKTEELSMFVLRSQVSPPITVELIINGKEIEMEVDTGAAVSIMGEKTVQEMFPEVQLKKSDIVLKTYTAESMEVVGEIDVEVEYQGQTEKLVLVVVSGNGPTLLGRNWLQVIKLNWNQIAHTRLDQVKCLDALLAKFSDVISDKLGTMTHHRAKLYLKENATPKFCKARPVPFAVQQQIEEELNRLQSQGIIEPVSHSEWATPVVPVPKKNGKLRLCGDFKVILNPVLDVDKYPLPRIDDLLATLSGGKKFTKIDLAHAYQQMLLDDQSKELVTINTHKGLYRYTRLPFGVASAPAMFQRTMDIILQGIPRVICYIDDILITGANEEEHYQNLEEVFRRLQYNGVTVSKSKCNFLCDSVEYLGYRISSEGLHATEDKLKAILDAPKPRNVQQLRSFLGLVHYYSKFIPNLASLLAPLTNLLRKNIKWEWSDKCEEAMLAVKEKLVSADVLVHYDPCLPIKLATDASSYGLGAVISHVYPDNSERPIAFASRTLSTAERNYAQIEKEALSLVFGVRKFNQYLYARKFTLVTDHKPLTSILGPKTGIPPLAAARLQRWAILLSAYQYDIVYRDTKSHANADALSRLPLHCLEEHTSCVGASYIFNMTQIESLPVTSSQLENATRYDPILGKVLHYTRYGWPDIVPSELQPYFNRRNELTIESNCILWGIRVVIPNKFHKKVLNELHESHMGICKMKSLARSHVWWPAIDREIESLSKSCEACLAMKNTPVPAPLHPWAWPQRPWQRIHIDFAGPIFGKTYLLIIDAHSKWPEIWEVSPMSSFKTIEILRHVFSVFGLPEQIVSDNGPQFISSEFSTFCKKNGIKHIRSAPYHPSTNGAIERFVQTFKRALKSGRKEGRQTFQIISNFLLKYRSTPHSVTGVSPCSLMLKREVRTVLSLLRPSQDQKVASRQADQKANHDKSSRLRTFTIGQEVMVRSYRNKEEKWVSGIIVSKSGNLTYLVELSDGTRCKRHIDQLSSREVVNVRKESIDTYDFSTTQSDDTPQDGNSDSNLPSSENNPNETNTSENLSSIPTDNDTPNNVRSSPYPQRNRRPPVRYSEQYW